MHLRFKLSSIYRPNYNSVLGTISTGQHGEHWELQVEVKNEEDDKPQDEEHGLEQVEVERLNSDEGTNASDGWHVDFEGRAVLARTVHEPLISCFVRATFVVAELVTSTDPNSFFGAQQNHSLNNATLWKSNHCTRMYEFCFATYQVLLRASRRRRDFDVCRSQSHRALTFWHPIGACHLHQHGWR